jgi:16S rRNA (guanine527-N7)-methyltransferase
MSFPSANPHPEHAQRAAHIQKLLSEAGLAPLDPTTAERFATYISLFIRWNTRTNLSSIRDEDGIIRRHLVESIAVARILPVGIVTLLDYGSGGGLPGLPIALCRPEIRVTLAESQNKKAAFLQEAVRALALNATVHAARAEALPGPYDCVTLRAVDRMEAAVAAAARLVRPAGYLALMTTRAHIAVLQQAAGAGFAWRDPSPIPSTHDGLLAVGISAAT